MFRISPQRFKKRLDIVDPDPTVTVPTYLLTIFSENRQNNLILKPDRRPEIYAKQDGASFCDKMQNKTFLNKKDHFQPIFHSF